MHTPTPEEQDAPARASAQHGAANVLASMRLGIELLSDARLPVERRAEVLSRLAADIERLADLLADREP